MNNVSSDEMKWKKRESNDCSLLDAVEWLTRTFVCFTILTQWTLNTEQCAVTAIAEPEHLTITIEHLNIKIVLMFIRVAFINERKPTQTENSKKKCESRIEIFIFDYETMTEHRAWLWCMCVQRKHNALHSMCNSNGHWVCSNGFVDAECALS